MKSESGCTSSSRFSLSNLHCGETKNLTAVTVEEAALFVGKEEHCSISCF